MILTPCKEKDWEVLTWCFYLEKEIKGECPKDYPHKKIRRKNR
jgi:hypothetical protein